LVLPFWYRLTRVVPDEGPLNGCVCVCVAVLGLGRVTAGLDRNTGRCYAESLDRVRVPSKMNADDCDWRKPGPSSVSLRDRLATIDYCTARRRVAYCSQSVRPSVCLSVCHTPVLCYNRRCKDFGQQFEKNVENVTTVEK